MKSTLYTPEMLPNVCLADRKRINYINLAHHKYVEGLGDRHKERRDNYTNGLAPELHQFCDHINPEPEPEPKNRPCQIKWADSRYSEDEATGYLHDADTHDVAHIGYNGAGDHDPNQVTAWGTGPLEGIEVDAPTRDEAKELFQSAFEKWLGQFYEIIPFSVAYEVTP